MTKDDSKVLRLWRIAPIQPGEPVERRTEATGRWHRGSKPLIYASATPELAVLEALAHLQRPIRQHWLVSLTLREPVAVVRVRGLPSDWVSRQTATRDIGERWLERGTETALIVPSALCAHASNVLIACDRVGSRQLICRAVRPFVFDRRLIAGA